MKSYFIDTNVFIYAQGEAHKYKSPCQIIMRLIALDELYAVTSTEVLQEILYRYAYLRKKELGLQMVQNILAIIHEVLPVEKADVLLALELLRCHSSINSRDALHAAVALHSGFKYVLSADKHFDRIRGLQRFDPCDI